MYLIVYVKIIVELQNIRILNRLFDKIIVIFYETFVLFVMGLD